MTHLANFGLGALIMFAAVIVAAAVSYAIERAARRGERR